MPSARTSRPKSSASWLNITGLSDQDNQIDPGSSADADFTCYDFDPLKLAADYWPRAGFYDKQTEIILSVRDNLETVVVAGNKLGKDYVAGFVALSFFLCPQAYFSPDYVRQVESRRAPSQPEWMVHTRRVVSTSVKDEHLDVLWGEIGRYVASSDKPLLHTQGGPLVVNYHEIRLADEMLAKNPLNYLKGQVSKKGEGMAGHHAAYTLFIGDEASGLEDMVKEQADGWAKKFLIFGNPNACENFFKRGVKAGDVLAP